MRETTGGISCPIRVVTWNLRYAGAERAARLAGRVSVMAWDVCLLQEVSKHAKDALLAAVAPRCSIFGIDWVLESRGRVHGAAILTRGDFTISEAESVRDLPSQERGVGALIHAPGGVVLRAVSWHAPNAAGQGVAFKMAGYNGIISYLKKLAGPVILGFDGNHWNLRTGLAPRPVPEPGGDPHYVENRFFSDDPQHSLRDAYLEYLRCHPDEYARVQEERPEGPLAVTYVRGTRARPQPDRFDYVFVSDHFVVERVEHDYEASIEAGSDHATVRADLRLTTGSGAVRSAAGAPSGSRRPA